MPTSPTHTVLVIFGDGEAPAGLARAAVRNGWPIYKAGLSPTQVEGELDRSQSRVVIVHIPASDEAALDLIRGLRRSRRCPAIIGISTAGTEGAEIRVRAAGASLFLPGTADADLIERSVQAMDVPARRAARAEVSALPRRVYHP